MWAVKQTQAQHAERLGAIEALIVKLAGRVSEHDAILNISGAHYQVCDTERKKHDEQMAVMMKTQESMAATQITMAETQKISAEYDAKNSENLELIADLVLTGKTVRSSLIWIAAVVGAIGTIAAGSAAAWFYMSGLANL